MAEPLSPGILHFYPGQKVLAFLVDGRLKTWAIAWGGPPTEQPPRPGEPFGEGPTNPGRYVIWRIAPYTTKTWKDSVIRWGTRLRPDPNDRRDVLYEISPGKWASVREATKGTWTRRDIMDEYRDLYGKHEVPRRWVFNAFGKVAIRYFKDKNNDGKLDAGETLEGEMFHSTAENEAETAQNKPNFMFRSHGCIHLKPIQRDNLIKTGVFARGRSLIIHTYDERYRRQPGDPAGVDAMIPQDVRL